MARLSRTNDFILRTYTARCTPFEPTTAVHVLVISRGNIPCKRKVRIVSSILRIYVHTFREVLRPLHCVLGQSAKPWKSNPENWSRLPQRQNLLPAVPFFPGGGTPNNSQPLLTKPVQLCSLRRQLGGHVDLSALNHRACSLCRASESLLKRMAIRSNRLWPSCTDRFPRSGTKHGEDLPAFSSGWGTVVPGIDLTN